MTDEQQEEARFKRIQETFGDDPDMLTAALAASEELLARYKSQLDQYRHIAITAARKLNSAVEKSRKRTERIASLRQDVAERVAAQYEEFKLRVGASTSLARVTEELEQVRSELAAREAECVEWQARYRDLHTRIETLRSAMAGLYPEMVPGASASSSGTSPDEAARKLAQPLAAVLRIINGRPPETPPPEVDADPDIKAAVDLLVDEDPAPQAQRYPNNPDAA